MARSISLTSTGVDHPRGAAWRELLTNFADQLKVTAIVPAFPGATTSLEERYATLPVYETVDELIANAAF